MDSEKRDKITQEELAVPYIAYESTLARAERMSKRHIIAIIVAVVLLFASNIAWLCVFAQYEISSYEVDMAADGDNDAVYNYIGEDGDIYNGSKDTREIKNPET